MTKELDEKLCAKYPKIFVDRHGDMRTTAMCWGFECGDGWYWLIDSLCSNLQWNTNNNNKKYVIKNKFLRWLLPLLDKLVNKIPGKHNFKRDRQINPLVIIRFNLISWLHKWRTTREYIYIESGRYPQIVASQVKEKFGGLRFYVQGASDVQYAVINWAESLSYHICEKCGSTKNIGQTQGWITTLCKECANPDSNWKSNEDLEKEENE
jgi:hypothetical protein